MDRETFADAVQTQALLTVAESGRFDSDKFKERVKEQISDDLNISEDDDSITVSDDRYDVTLDKESGDLTGSGTTEGIWPRVKTDIREMDGSGYKYLEDSEDLLLGVVVENEDDFVDVQIVVKDSEGNTVGEYTDEEPAEPEGKRFQLKGPEGTYTVEVKGTDAEGHQKTTKQKVELKENPHVKLEIVLEPDGGDGYVIPTGAKVATVKTTMTSSADNDPRYTYYYCWSDTDKVRPGLTDWERDEWTTTISGREIVKDDCEKGDHYLWIQVWDNDGVLSPQYVCSKKFTVHDSTDDEANWGITFTAVEPNETWTNEDVVVTPHYGKYLTEAHEILCEGEEGEGKDYLRNGTENVTVKTNNKKVTVSATDIAGNKVVAEYTVKNIDKIAPVITINPDTDEHYAQSHQTTVTITDDGGSKLNDKELKYKWVQGAEKVPEPAEYTDVIELKDDKAVISLDEVTGPDWFLWVRAIDIAGTLTTVNSKAFYMDNTNPNKEQPELFATTNSLKVTFKQKDANSGIDESTIEYSYKEKDAGEDKWSAWTTSSAGEKGYHTFENLVKNKEWVARTRVTDLAGNGPQISDSTGDKTDDIRVPTISWEPDDTWVNTDVKVTIEYPESKNTTLTKEYSVGDLNHWTTYDGSFNVAENDVVYAQQYDSTKQTAQSTAYNITNIDKQLPRITEFKVSSDKYVNTDLTLTGQAVDENTRNKDPFTNLSGIVKYMFDSNPKAEKDSAEWKKIAEEGHGVASTKQTTDIQGNGTYYFHVIDDADNIMDSDPIVVNNIDKDVPVVTGVDFDHAWRNQPKAIQVTATDAGTSSIVAFAITTSDQKSEIKDSDWKSVENGGHEFTWTSDKIYENGDYYAWVKDGAGSISDPKPVKVDKIERIAPTVKVSNDETEAKEHTATVTIQDEDGGSGLKQGKYTINYVWDTNPTAPTSWTGSSINQTQIDVAESGTKLAKTELKLNNVTGEYYLHVQAVRLTDWAENVDDPVATGKFVMDNQGPKIEFTFDANKAKTYAQSQTTVVTVTEQGYSEVNNDSLKYVWNNDGTTTPEDGDFTGGTYTSGGTVKSPEEKTGNNWYVWAIAKDNLGNTTKEVAGPFYLDNTNPTTVAPSTVPSTSTIKVTFNQTDAHSLINNSTREYRIREKTSPESTWSDWVKQDTSEEDGTHTFTDLKFNTTYEVQTQVTDNANNGPQPSTVKEQKTVDIATPTVTFTPAAGKWVSSDVKATITFLDSENSTLIREYSEDGGKTWHTISKPYEVIIHQNEPFSARQYDNSAAQQGKDTKIVNENVKYIDKQLPEVTELTAKNTDPTNNNYDLVGKAIDRDTRNLEGYGNNSGIIKYMFTTDKTVTKESTGWVEAAKTGSGIKTEWSKDFEVQTNGTYYLHVMDDAGNIGSKDLTITNIDKAPPVVTSATAPTTWSNEGKQISIQANDPGTSELKAYMITTNSSKPAPGADGWIPNTSGSWTDPTKREMGDYYVWVKDNAENVSDVGYHVQITRIEREFPSISVNSDTTAKMSNKATITLKDTGGSGLFVTTYTIKYKWTTSTQAPSTYDGETVTINVANTTTAQVDAPTEESNSYYLHVQVDGLKDIAGNVTTASTNPKNSAYGNFVIDVSKPTITFNPDGSTEYKQTYAPKINVTENPSTNNSGLQTSTYYYAWVNGNGKPAASDYSLKYTSGQAIASKGGSGIDGDNWHLWAKASDVAGNVQETQSAAFKFDNTKPNTTAPKISTVTTNSIAVTCQQSDAGVGLDKNTLEFGRYDDVTRTWTWEAASDKNNGTHVFKNLTYNRKYYIATRVNDALNNGVATTTTAVTGSTVAPSATTANIPVVTIDTLTPSGPTPGPVSVTAHFTAKDASHPDLVWEYSTDGGATYTTSTDQNKVISVSANVTINARQYDSVNKSNAQSESLATMVINNIDTAPPTVSKVSVPTTYTNGNIKFTITGTDSGITGTATSNYGIAGYKVTDTDVKPTAPTTNNTNGWEMTSTATNYQTTGTFPKKDHWVWAVDKAGNVSTAGYKVSADSILIENAAPTIEVTSSSSAATEATATVTLKDTGGSNLKAGEYTVQYAITTSADAPSTLSESIKITVTGSPATATGTIQVKPSTTNTYYVHVKGINIYDNANNVSSPVNKGSYVIDKSGPTITFGTNSGTWAKSHKSKITCTADNGGSTVKTDSLRYMWTQSASAPSDIATKGTSINSGGEASKSDGNGTWYLWAYATDMLGNPTTTKATGTFQFDNTAPTITASPASSTEYGKSYNVTLTVAKANGDTYSDLDTSTYKYIWVATDTTTAPTTGFTSGTAIGAYSGPSNATSKTYYLRATASDKAGNVFTKNFGPFYFDNKTPTISEVAQVPTGWTNASKKIKLKATDDASGLTRYWASTATIVPKSDTSGWKAIGTADSSGYYNPTDTYAAGSYNIYVKDKAGNISSKSTLTIDGIETTPPAITVVGSTTAAKRPSATIKLTDGNSGFPKTAITVKYSWDGTGYGSSTTITPASEGATEASTSVPIAEGQTSGTHTLYVQCTTAKDRAGNTITTTTASGTVVVDNSGPTITITPNGSPAWKKSYTPSVTISDNSGGAGLNTSSVKYKWSTSNSGDGTEALSGVTSGTAKALPEYGLNSANGTYYLRVTAADTLGNSNTVSASFKFDNTAPNNTAPSVQATTNSLIVTGAQVDKIGNETGAGIQKGTWEFAWKLNSSTNGWSSWLPADDPTSGNSKTITGLTMNTKYDVKTRCKDTLNNGPGESSVKTVTTSDIPTPSISPSTTAWTNKDVTVTITYPKSSGTADLIQEHAVVAVGTAYKDIKSTDWVNDTRKTKLLKSNFFHDFGE